MKSVEETSKTWKDTEREATGWKLLITELSEDYLGAAAKQHGGYRYHHNKVVPAEHTGTSGVEPRVHKNSSLAASTLVARDFLREARIASEALTRRKGVGGLSSSKSHIGGLHTTEKKRSGIKVHPCEVRCSTGVRLCYTGNLKISQRGPY